MAVTHEDLAAIVDGIAPVILDHVQTATKPLLDEIGTLREALRTVRAELHAAHQALETRVFELEAQRVVSDVSR